MVIGKTPTEKNPAYMNIEEFVNFGYLQEVNRQFFHPLGLALEVSMGERGNINSEGEWKLSSIQDHREDPEGMIFGKGVIDTKKRHRVQNEQYKKGRTRTEILGYRIQEETKEK